MLSRLVRERKIKAFTLTELMVSFGILAVLVLVLVFGVGRFRSTQRNEQLRVEFLNSLTNLRAEFKKDVEIALLNNSPTAEVNITADAQNRFYGIGTNVDAADQFSFQVFKPLHQSLTLPVKIDSNANILHVIPPASTTGPNNERAYLQGALTSAKYFVVSNQTAQAIFERPASSSANSASALTLGSTQPLNTFGPQFTSQSNLIRTAEKVIFSWNQSSKVLTRTSDYRTDAQPTQDVLFSNVLDFRVGYTFRLRQDAGVNDNAILPNTPVGIVSALNLPNTMQEAWTASNCAPSGQQPVVNGQIISNCVKPKNIDRIYVHLKFQTDLPVAQFASLDAGIEGLRVRFDRENSHVLVDFELTSRSFSLMTTALASGMDVTCQPNAGSHCKPQCSEIFVSRNSSDANWIGYGRYRGHPQGASDYCLCWTDHSTNQIETTIGNWSLLPNWTAAGENSPEDNQVEACGRHYGCDSNFLRPDSNWQSATPGRIVHPGYKLACDCLQGPTSNHFVNRSADFRPRFDTATGPQQGGYTLNSSITQYRNNSTSNPYLEPQDRHLSCARPGQCISSMSRFYGIPSTSSLAQNTLDARCGCLSRNIPYACDTRNPSQAQNDSACSQASGSTIDYAELNFAKLCNRDYRNNSSNPLSCPNTWAPANQTGSVNLPNFNLTLDVFSTNNPDLSQPQARYNIENSTGNISYSRRFGISRTLAEACECLANNIAGEFTTTGTGSSMNYGYRSNLDTTSSTPNLNTAYPPTLAQGIANLDFRVPNSNPTTAVPNLSSPAFPTSNQINGTFSYPTFGSNQSQFSPNYSVVTTDSAGTTSFSTWASSQSCGANHCTLNGGQGLGCCTQQQASNVASISAVDNRLQPWNGFCRTTGPQACSSISLSGATTIVPQNAVAAEMYSVRRYITQRTNPNGAANSNANLPADCAGPSGSGVAGQ